MDQESVNSVAEDIPEGVEEVLNDPSVSTGKISLLDILSGFDIKSSFMADYNELLSEEYLARVRKEGLSVLIESLNDGNIVLMSLCFLSTLFFIVLFQEYFLGGNETDNAEEEEEEPDPPRDFTVEQLRDFDGVKNDKIFIAMKGEVFDVTRARDFYGPESTYHCFAGRDASRAMAKLSFDEEDLSNQNLDDLGIFEKDVLQNWYDKFKYAKQYPIVGKLSFPDVGEGKRVFTVLELQQYKGEKTEEVAGKAKEDILPGRVDREILICLKGKVYDVSYGGTEMYGVGGPYHIFAGIDASRALAKMSFDREDVESRDLSDLTEQQLKTLDDWEKKFSEVKKYPVVGVMNDADESASSGVYVIPENMKKGNDAKE